MGCCKQLLPLGDKPVIRRCLEALLVAGLEEIVVVLGPSGQEIAKVIEGLPVTIVWNNEPNSDMTGSVRVGMQAVGQTASAVIVCLVDHPLVLPETIRTLIQSHEQEADKIIIPTCRGRKGHPTLFPRAALKELPTVSTLRDIVRKDSARVKLVDVTDSGTVMDMDTPEDYQVILDTYQQSRP